MKKSRGHFCRICRRALPNEKFTGSGHRDHVCKECASARKRGRRAAPARAGGIRQPENSPVPSAVNAEGVVGAIRSASLDVASIRKEIDYLVSRARAGEDRLVTLGPLLFFSTSTGDAWMLDPADGYAACLARDGVQEPVEIADKGERFAIEWRHSYRVEGEAMVFVQHSTGRVSTVLGYPCPQLEAAARRMVP